jgi:homoserine dehydrogenase
MNKIYIAGTGNVSKNLLNLINNKSGRIKIIGIENSRGGIYSEEGITNSDLDSFLKNPLDFKKETNVERLNFNTYVDLRTASKDGNIEKDTYFKMFRENKSVVTANKSGLANFYPEIEKSSKENKIPFLYEATVAGGLPIFSLLRGSFNGFEVKEFTGLVNLTSNFILKNVRRGMPLDKAKEMAIKEGVAETNMDDDINGTDSARKAVILSNSVFHHHLRLKELKYGGANLDNIKEDTLLLVNIKKDREFSIKSELFSLKDHSPFMELSPMGMAAVFDFKERAPLYVSEDTDGPLETAGAVLNDILTSEYFVPT